MKTKHKVSGLLLLVALVLLSACGAPPDPSYEETDALQTESEAVLESSASDPGDGNGEALPQAEALNASIQERMIIKNGEMALLVEDTDIAIDMITQVAVDNGGYIISSQTWSAGERKSGTIQIAVRSEKFETAIRRLRDIGLEVLRESASGEDVTGEYVDLESSLRNLEATRDRIASFLEETKTVEEALDVNAELAEIEAEIEQTKGRMKYLSGRAAFSTITINLEMPLERPPVSAPDTLIGRIQQAVTTQGQVFRSLLNGLIWLVIVPGPYALALAIIVYVARRASRNSKLPDDNSTS